MHIIKVICDRLPAKTIVFIFGASIVYSYFRGFEASMFIFLGGVAVWAVMSLIAHKKDRRETE